MKKVLLMFATFLLSFGTLIQRTSAQDDVYVSYQEFYDNLSPYGQWISDSTNGYVWIPNVEDDFRPYFTSGHWAMTEYGNTWVSDYPWGWACFHYGRWIYNDYYGWVWIPGSEWGPGWVAWRWGDGYCGWAPLYPGVAWVGIGYTCPDDWWIFMHPRYLYKPRYHDIWRSDYWHGPRHTRILLENSHFVTHTYENGNTRFYGGPSAAEVTQITRQPVQVYQLGHTPVRGGGQISNNIINIYRPARIEQVNTNGIRATPSRVMQAPRQVTRSDELTIRWNQPRQFKTDIQRQNPAWNRGPVRSAPLYNNQRTAPAIRLPNTPVRTPTRTTPVRPAPVRPSPGRR